MTTSQSQQASDQLLNVDQVVAHFARVFGVDRRTVVERWMRKPGFPKPAIVIPGTRARAWTRADIESYGRQSEPSTA